MDIYSSFIDLGLVIYPIKELNEDVNNNKIF